jgi:hypothetical protein
MRGEIRKGERKERKKSEKARYLR